MQTGKIANICGKYVIDGEKKNILKNNHLLLPNDTVEYTISDNMIMIHKIISRAKDIQYILGIVSNIENNIITLFCPNYPKTFNPNIKNNNYNIHNVLIIAITINNIDVIKKYDSIMDRSNDVNIMLELYKLSSLNKINLDYIVNDNYYTKNEIVDLTHLHTFNVDPTESKDFDDAISIENNKIYVHIVDFNSMIPKNSNIDYNAFSSSFTLYLPEHIENILPKELAEDKLSLIKGLPRNVITVEYTLDNCEIVKYDIYRSIIVIKERYDYKNFVVNDYMLLLNFYKKWSENSVNINVPHVKLNICNNIIDSYSYESNCDIAHKIIEMMMILTNSTISNHIPKNVPQRFHSSIKMNNNKLLQEKLCDNDVINNILFIKKYRNALYSNTDMGHFGLGLKTYTHFTSPIRRYFDVTIHRLLAGYMYNNIEEILDHINSMEKNIDNIVKLYNMLKILDYLNRNKDKKFVAYVLNINEMGITVIIDGLLYCIFIFTKKIYKIGDKINIKIKNVIWEKLEVKATD